MGGSPDSNIGRLYEHSTCNFTGNIHIIMCTACSIACTLVDLVHLKDVIDC